MKKLRRLVMKFKSEIILDEIRSFEQVIQGLKKSLKNCEDEGSLILWELGNLIEEENKIEPVFWTYLNSGLRIYLNPLTADEFDKLIKTIYQIMDSYNFVEKETKTENIIIFEKGGKEVRVELISKSCDVVKTGKLIEEVKTVCNFIKN